ncbi:MAG: Cytochrome oxidase assembly [Magnetococcales bacterium]|nr:Cytochrome oxidase assembly [Magnetococcales bacterium]HIJ84763.1 heme A synthase [Magnetococcales bacterium]
MKDQNDKKIALWLLTCCAMIFSMILVGGLTRLTDSGLSIILWNPALDWLPPMNLAEWEEFFARYRQSPEFKIINYDINLEGFKSIFWLEYTHRLLGRVMGVVFLLPMLYFMLQKQIRGRLAMAFMGIFLLGILQGNIGMFLVQSGLVDAPRISPYRLTLHLGLAVTIYAAILWLALSKLNPKTGDDHESFQKLVVPAILLGSLIFLTILSGGAMAGANAGLAFNSYPLMDGRWIPTEYMDQQPVYQAFFEHIPTVQWNHRALTLTVFSGSILFWLMLKLQLPRGKTQTLGTAMVFMAHVEICLGIATLLLRVPVPLASAHQASAMILFTLVLILMHRLVHRQV